MTKILRADVMLTPTGEVENAELEMNAQGRIVYAGASRPHSRVTHDLAGHALMPGLVNGHSHSAMTVLRGISNDEGFSAWLAAVQQAEQQLTRDDVVVGLELAMLEMIETGTTSFADMYYWDAGLLELVRSAGMRVCAAPAFSTAEGVPFSGVSAHTGADVLDETESLAARFAGDAHITLAYGPHAPYSCPPALLREVAARSKRTGIPIQIHVSESVTEVQQIVELHGSTPARYLATLGVFEVPVLAAHGVHLTPDEIEMFARVGAAVSHNPVSNLKLGCGVAPLPDLISAGVPLTLGTDSVASNNSLDLFEEIKLATLLHRGVRHDASAVRATDVLDIATRSGAQAIGFSDTGALEHGKLADVIALDLTGAHAAPRTSLASHLAFSARGSDVRHVFIGGRHIYADGAHLTLDAGEILERVRVTAARLCRPSE
jgi:5-methylthioadenosine/S-adenosylhomocysteine deaminase